MPEMIAGPTVHQIAKRRAKYSRYDWIVWRERTGQWCAAPVSLPSIRMAMLATGTQQTFALYGRRTGHLTPIWWWVANNIRRQLKAGHYV